MSSFILQADTPVEMIYGTVCCTSSSLSRWTLTVAIVIEKAVYNFMPQLKPHERVEGGRVRSAGFPQGLMKHVSSRLSNDH